MLADISVAFKSTVHLVASISEAFQVLLSSRGIKAEGCSSIANAGKTVLHAQLRSLLTLRRWSWWRGGGVLGI